MSFKTELRPFKTSDAAELIQFIKEDLIHVNGKNYTQKQIESIVAYYTPEQMIKLSEEADRLFLVAVLNNRPVGTASLVNNEVHMVFVDRNFHGKGIGKNLIERIEKVAKENGISKLKVNSSLNAPGFYQKLGFKVTDSNKKNNDVSETIQVVEMEKPL